MLNKHSVIGLILLLACIASCSTKPAKKLSLFPINLAPLSDWQERHFSGSTLYSIIGNEGETILKAQSSNSASMLFKRLTVDLTKTPYLNWHWKINNTLGPVDEKSRQGDDYPARLYIAIKPETLSITPRALTYVWSSNSQKLTNWNNAFTNNVVMLALQSGAQFSQQWLSEKRNLRDDLKQYFNEEITSIEAIALMTDTDNSHSSTTAFYKNIYFSKH